ncbi:hypothetical protein VTK73DRAFT_7227 [Phialemonium thermophilum]|uniref:RNA polymerase I-specific transcription initiation factor rrn3 n=1 Tax=Phialemonium thermophilum TaxID=223376 RepID=A0ABR3WFL7_9PEZI
MPSSLAPGAQSQATLVSNTGVVVRPILRKGASSILGTRKRNEENDAHESPISKRQKTVMFDESLNIVRDIGKKSLEDAKREVREALERHARDDDEDYDNLKELFSNDQRQRHASSPLDGSEGDDSLSSGDILVYIVALTSHVSMLGKSCSGLIRSVLQCQWLARDDVFTRAYVQFLATLSSAQGSYMVHVLSMMVDKFSETRAPRPIPGYSDVTRETMRQRLHLGLRYILGLFPGARPILLNLIATKFPYSEDSKKVHMAYVDNLLRLREYSPDPRDIMELITSKVVKLDVEMQLDLEDMDDETTAAVMLQLRSSESEGPTHDEDDSDESDTESVASDESDPDDQFVRVLNIKNRVEKLDGLLDALFATYDPYFADPDSAEAITCYEDILSDFSNIVLPTYKSRHSQFLVFYFAQKSKHLTEMFVGTLFNIAFESTRPSIVKQSAVAYLASFVARGARVDTEQVRTIACTLLNYMDYHRANYEPDCRGPDLRRYSQFYALSQGLLYLFCFRWRDLVDLERSSPTIDRDDPTSFLGQDLQWIDSFRSRLQNNIYSRLNPLKVCSPVIVAEFAKLAHHLGLMYVYPRLESNKSIQLAQFVGGSYSTGGALRDTGYDPQNDKWSHLDPYCPFDPYQLPLSRRRLHEAETYIPWTSIPGLNRDEDDESDDGVADDGDEDMDAIQEDTATDEEI